MQLCSKYLKVFKIVEALSLSFEIQRFAKGAIIYIANPLEIGSTIVFLNLFGDIIIY